MPTGFAFTALAAEIRIIIYKLAFVAPEPIIVGAPVPATKTLSAQLLRTCRTCHKEGSPILYGENIFSMDARYSSLEQNLLCNVEHFGENANFIRHIQTHWYATGTLKRMRSMRGLRCMLQNLSTLTITLLEYRAGGKTYYTPRTITGRSQVADLHAWLTTTRGAFQNLTRIFVERTCDPVPYYKTMNLKLHLISENTKVEPQGKEVDIDHEFAKSKASKWYCIGDP